MTYKEILDEATNYLKKHNIAEVEIQAWQLLEFVFGINRSYYFAHSDDIIEEIKAKQYMSLIHRRAKREPLQYITNEAYFMGHKFYVDEKVLIPRMDTETLVEEVCKLIKSDDAILDICTGSGCIAIALKLEYPMATVTGVDISSGALEVARKNAKDLEADVDFVESDLFEQVRVKTTERYNVIVSNPPYIRLAVIDELMVEVKEHEPLLALDGKDDGLYFYRKIVKQAKSFLLEEGYLALEIGYDQGDDLVDMMTAEGYKNIKVVQDLAGLDRVVIGQT